MDLELRTKTWKDLFEQDLVQEDLEECISQLAYGREPGTRDDDAADRDAHADVDADAAKSSGGLETKTASSTQRGSKAFHRGVFARVRSCALHVCVYLCVDGHGACFA